jgi:hypothetical protein
MRSVTIFSSASISARGRGGFAVADDPDVGADAGVVKHVGGQADDRFDEEQAC